MPEHLDFNAIVDCVYDGPSRREVVARLIEAAGPWLGDPETIGILNLRTGSSAEKPWSPAALDRMLTQDDQLSIYARETVPGGRSGIHIAEREGKSRYVLSVPVPWVRRQADRDIARQSAQLFRALPLSHSPAVVTGFELGVQLRSGSLTNTLEQCWESGSLARWLVLPHALIPRRIHPFEIEVRSEDFVLLRHARASSDLEERLNPHASR